MLVRRSRVHAAVLAALALAPSAGANVPAPQIKTNIVSDQLLGVANGILTTKVTYTDSTATAATSTGDTIGLQAGLSFLLRTCLAYHLYGKPPLSSCAERAVDTRANTATVYTYAPSVTLRRQPRPERQPWAYFTAYAEILSFNGSFWLISAHSWPDHGLQGAGIAVVEHSAAGGALPANSPVALDGAYTNAVNSGQPDSICTTIPVASDGSVLPAGVSADHPAFRGAPGYYEVGMPTGDYVDEEPRGIMLIIHSGAWAVSGVLGVQRMRPDADRWRSRGWETVNFTFRACAQSAADVLWFYDRARTWFGDDAKICALGTSSGAHLALLIGAYRPDLYCAVSNAGPTDLRSVQNEVAYDATSGLQDQTNGGRQVRNLAAAAFGEENLPAYSPAAQTAGTLQNTRILQAFSADDALVPYQQTADLDDAMHAANAGAYVDSIQLSKGTVPFAHGYVTQAALDALYTHEERLVAPISRPTVGLGKR